MFERSAYKELPDGTFECTVRFSWDQLQLLQSNCRGAWPQSPSTYEEDDEPIDPRPVYGAPRMHDAARDNHFLRAFDGSSNATIARITELTKSENGETVTFDLTMDAAEKPPTQILGVDGLDDSKIMGAAFLGLQDWKHPAAPYLRTIFMHRPFQKFCMARAGIAPNSFQAPMPVACSTIKAAAASGGNEPLEGIGKLMDEYIEWVKTNDFGSATRIMWPEIGE